MDSETHSGTLALSPALAAEIEAAAEQEGRPAAALLCELVEHGLLERRRWLAQAAQERQRAIELGIHDPADDEPMTDEYRLSIRDKIDQGLKSLQEGKGTDSAAFFAQIYAEVDDLERQGHE